MQLGFKDDKAQREAAEIMQKLYKLFKDTDATQVEINPLSETAEGVMCMDAKLGFDENAEFRQEKVFSLRDKTQEDAAEVCHDYVPIPSSRIRSLMLTGCCKRYDRSKPPNTDSTSSS